MDRQELIKANEKLMAMRKAAGTEPGPKPLRDIQMIVGHPPGLDMSLPSSQKTTSSYTDQSSLINRELWDAFDSDRHPDLIRAVKSIKIWWNEEVLKDAGCTIILGGGYGCGKSHLARAIHRMYGPGSVFYNEVDLLEKIQDTYGPMRGSEKAIIDDCRRARLLILDDLGAGEVKEASMSWLRKIYYKLFNDRKELGRSTLITTNLPLTARDEEGEYSPLGEWLGGRVFDRIMGMIETEDRYLDLFNVPSYRRKGFSNKQRRD